MAVDSPNFISSALKVYNVEVNRAITAQEERLAQLTAAYDQLQDTITTMGDLPTKLRHQLMVPLGRHAFFPGHLTRTNEIIVHLGDSYFVETTAIAAKGILQRKLAVLAEGVSKAKQQLQALNARLKVTDPSLEGSSGNNAVEIRSSLEESDALLATVSKHRHSKAATLPAARSRQDAVSRVKGAGRYSYTPLSIHDTPGSQQQVELDAEDAALQARLQELIRLEEQQEADEQAAAWGQPVQQSQQHMQLASIQEGDEEAAEAEDWPEGAGTASASATTSSTASMARLDAVQHLQQLEGQIDSDDEDQHHHHQQQVHQAAAASVMSSASSVMERSPQQQLLQPQPSSSSMRPAARSNISGSGLKSALKKGFLSAPATKQKPDSMPEISTEQRNSASTCFSAAGASSSSSTAFTGAVVERPVPAAVEAVGTIVERNNAIPAVLEKPTGLGAAAVQDNSGAASRPSKFKLRRMGFESGDH